MTSIPTPRAALVADIGTVTTRVTLIDAVDGEGRLIGQAEVPSTYDPPASNAAAGLLAAAERIGEQAGRRLIQDGRLIVPQNSERDGVDAVVVCTSAAGMLGVVVAAIAVDISARSAQRATRVGYTTLLETVTLDDAARGGDAHDTTWIERQVQTLLGLQPDVVVIAGGLEDGARDSLVRLAHIVGLTAQSARVDAEGQARRETTRRPVIFAGNSGAREQVIESLSELADLTVVENVRPALEAEQLEPARRALRTIYAERQLPQLPGAAELGRLSAAPLQTSCDASGLMTRFIAERYGRSVLALDVGATSTTAHLAAHGRYSPAVIGGVGVGYGAGRLLAEQGVEALRRWLPFPISQRDLTHRLLNRALRPHMPPTTREDLLVEHAAAREALASALAALWDEQPGAEYDLVIAGGGVLAHAPNPAYAALSVLDALQPAAHESVLAIELHLDSLGLMTTCGALAFADADSALTLFERDLMRNTPLATCVVALGDGRLGEPALEAELTLSNGTRRSASVAHGQIARLALPPGRKAQLTLRPAAGVRIGRNAPGAEVASDVAAISGSALGVVIDARGRPLRLPDDGQLRQQLLWSWLTALGAEQGDLPYAPLDSAVEPPLPSLLAGRASERRSSDRRTSEPRPAPSEPGPPAPGGTLDGDLAALRQSFEEPQKRRGLFRRRG